MSGAGSVDVMDTGLLNTVQDLGRPGLRKFGVGSAGAMDGFALAAANLMVGNPVDAAGIEVTTFPFRMRLNVRRRVAATGADTRLVIGKQMLPPWWSIRVEPGTEVRVEAPRRGMRGYLAVAGGIAVAEILGSRSTDLKAGFGGSDGRMLQRGQNLPLGHLDADCSAGWDSFGIATPETRMPLAPLTAVGDGTTVVRVLPAAEHGELVEEARNAFWASEWQLSTSSNRVGYRLMGPVLRLHRPLELLSHGILPGVIQLPPSGQPMIQMSDANTCGGYPKIGLVIGADLWRLAQVRLGRRIRFSEVSLAQALAARDELDAALAAIRHTTFKLLTKARWAAN
jgi:biotin-dependent carboxylase-like uncharacterized protein